MAFYQGQIFDLRSDPNAIGNFGKMGMDMIGEKNRKEAEAANRQLRSLAMKQDQAQRGLDNTREDKKLGMQEEQQRYLREIVNPVEMESTKALTDERRARTEALQNPQPRQMDPDAYRQGAEVWFKYSDSLRNTDGSITPGKEKEYYTALERAKRYMDVFEGANKSADTQSGQLQSALEPKELTQDIVNRAKAAAGGNIEQAREILKQQGYKVE